MNKKRLAAFGAAVCLAASLAGCGSDKTAVYVQQVSVLSGISSTDKFSAMVVSENITEIKKDSDKDVSELLVKEGQDVKEGDPLFTYDTDQLQLAADKLDLEREQLNRTTTPRSATWSGTGIRPALTGSSSIPSRSSPCRSARRKLSSI